MGLDNGIDYDLYNPATDKMIAENYDETTFEEGKKAGKLAIQRELGMPEDPDV